MSQATSPINRPSAEPPYLLTPGPLSTSRQTREAMLRDCGSWDAEFARITAEVREELLAIAGVAAAHYSCVPVQGSGTFAVEAALASALPRDGKALLLINGAYGRRAAQILDYLGRAHQDLDLGDCQAPRAQDVERLLRADPTLDTVFLVHCETSSGILNPLAEIAEVVKAHGRTLVVDAMSAFGALPLAGIPFDILVASANKCLEGVPGCAFVIARRELLEASQGRAHSLSLDLYQQWRYLESTGQWRFTPPTHCVLALHAALRQHRAEGGSPARLARYRDNQRRLLAGMRKLGFRPLLGQRWQSPIITAFHYPQAGFDFPRFYTELKQRGFIIYPGKLTEVDTFRIGCIGQIDGAIIERLLQAIATIHAGPALASRPTPMRPRHRAERPAAQRQADA